MVSLWSVEKIYIIYT